MENTNKMVKTGDENLGNRTSIKEMNIENETQLIMLAVNNAFEKVAKSKELFDSTPQELADKNITKILRKLK